ncbi:lasso RiPP family leader peptide-containing protein [Plantactinospora sp. GCM10030261]
MNETRESYPSVEREYEPPRLRRLGTLAELTKAGEGPIDDGQAGFQGAS